MKQVLAGEKYVAKVSEKSILTVPACWCWGRSDLELALQLKGKDCVGRISPPPAEKIFSIVFRKLSQLPSLSQ